MEGRPEGDRATNQAQGDIDEWGDLEPGDLRPDVLDADDLGPMDMGDDVEVEVGESRSRMAAGVALASFAGLTAGAAVLGRVASRRAPRLWFRMLRKPPFQPPNRVFGPVWTALYGLIAASGYRVWRSPPGKARNRALALWGTQLALNSAWSPLFFGARRKRAAFVDLLALLGVVAAYGQVTRKFDKPAAALVLPYLGWLGFAGVLNGEIIRRNRGWRRVFAR